MSEKYTNPAIEEAIFDIRTRSGKALDEQLFNSFLKEFTDYSPQEPLRNINIDTKNMTQQAEITGYRGVSQDQKHIIQFRKDGLSFIRLKPYNGWDENYKEALRLWAKYCEIMEPVAITRIATRFINNFQIQDTKLEEYFSTYIQNYNNISPVWNQMSYRLLMSHNNVKSHIVFDSNIDQNTQGVNIVFDIDVFSDGLALSCKDTPALGNIFTQLREVKNTIFEKSITDKMREMIK